ncbi:acyl-CoA thioesterase [Roseomonas alkaliterrae]|uniref:Acyl-CoA thioesterase YciA n=1 Tax=Neoroseomonas alkaliterrae TaxID=1452450 RepID=A0A840XID3_9PROT|nr:acyl-CoA thioesterase [Neoroseomonas alkaliterrae]MBB5688208.1 acyl-CoA thioesterase YciA [Neoroseomonas alkaliterrae]MBR0676790.1 acyl-CoA thioesterase [Neoroseomonas alkaliterrae]
MSAAPPREAPQVRVIAMPADANPAGDIFGGWLMAHMDQAGASVALRRARGRVATVAVEAMAFHLPVRVGDEVSLYGRLLGVGRSSIRVHVEAWRRDRTAEDAARVTEATFTFVALDADGRPRPVPPEAA